MPFIETSDRTNLFYKDWGSGLPAVFVAGWALTSDMWQYQMTYLTDRGVRCIAYDPRGHGRSDQPGHGYDFDTLADDLAALLQQLDLNDVTLAGHSMGCGVIVRYLTRHGAGRVARIALLAPTLPFLLKTADNPDGIDRIVFDNLRESFSTDFPKWLAENARPFVVEETSAELVDWVIGLMRQCSLKAVIECNRAVTETDFRAELPAITVPALVIHGDRDVSAPLPFTGSRTAALLPAGRLTVYEGAPHGLIFTHKDRLNRDLLGFVQGPGK